MIFDRGVVNGTKLICIAGKNDIAVDVLAFLRNDYNVVVLCNKTENGKNGYQKSLRYFATKWKIPEVKIDDLYDVDNLIFISLEYDCLVDIGKFRKSARFYNVHFSDLPKYKGQYTSAWCILNGEKETAVTLHMIDKGIDTGEIIAKERFDINDMDCREVYLELVKRGKRLILKNFKNIYEDNVVSYPQPVEQSTFYSIKSINYSGLKLEINQTAEMIARQIRAYSFREYQLPTFMSKEIIDYKITNQRSIAKAGTVVFENDQSVILSTVDYNIILYFDKFRELINACSNGNMDSVNKICSIGRHINVVDEKGWSPLFYAIENNQKDVVSYLISMGADITLIDFEGWNVLKNAADVWIQRKDDYLYNLFIMFGISTKQENYNGMTIERYVEIMNGNLG